MAQRSNPVREDGTLAVPFTASAAITDQYKIVKLSAADTVVLASAGTDKCIGINQRTTETTNDEIPVKTSGYSLVRSGAAFAAGAYLTADSAGRAVATTTSTDRTFAIATQAANNADEFVECKLLDIPVLVSAVL